MNEKYQNVLITGGAGRLGRYLYTEFKEQGYQVSLFDQKAPSEQPFPVGYAARYHVYPGRFD
jgi:nucleoside-diphosphate-sugar epimerase